jgi:malate synthase
MISTTTKNIYSSIDIKMKVPFSHKQILSYKALKFLVDLHTNFNYRRLELIGMRKSNNKIKKNVFPSTKVFSNRVIQPYLTKEKNSIYEDINNTEKVLFVDFKQTDLSTWNSLVETHISLKEIVSKNPNNTIEADDSELNVAVNENIIIVCGRDLDTDELNIQVDGNPICASFVDIGLYLFHNAKTIIASGSIPYVHVCNIQNFYEAKLWNAFLNFTEQELSLLPGTIKAIVSLNDNLPEFEIRHIHEEFGEHLID